MEKALQVPCLRRWQNQTTPLKQPKKQAKETGEEGKVFKQKHTGAEDTLAAESQGRGEGWLQAKLRNLADMES